MFDGSASSRVLLIAIGVFLVIFFSMTVFLKPSTFSFSTQPQQQVEDCPECPFCATPTCPSSTPEKFENLFQGDANQWWWSWDRVWDESRHREYLDMLRWAQARQKNY